MPFDGHLTLIDRSNYRDGAFNRIDARARKITCSLVRSIICGFMKRSVNGLWHCMLHLQGGSVRSSRSHIIHPDVTMMGTTTSLALAHAWCAYRAISRFPAISWLHYHGWYRPDRDANSHGTSVMYRFREPRFSAFFNYNTMISWIIAHVTSCDCVCRYYR